MAWTTSACLRARPPVADQAPTRIAHLSSAVRRALLHASPGEQLGFLAATLGLLAPLLPTDFLAVILMMSGVSLMIHGDRVRMLATVGSAAGERPDSPPPSDELPPQPPLRRESAKSDVPELAADEAEDWADLIARINHELRTPLNAVIGFSEVMALEMFGPLGNARYQDYVRHIRDSAGDLLKAAEDTLALTALLSGKRCVQASACDLEGAVADAWDSLARKSAALDIALELTLPANVEVLSEPRALRQALTNVLSEALQRTAPGGAISLMAVADGELVEIQVMARPNVYREAGSLPMHLARTLLEMQGSTLLEIASDGGWRAVTVLDRAVQPDFFSEGSVTRARQHDDAFAL